MGIGISLEGTGNGLKVKKLQGHLEESRALQYRIPTEARQLLLPAVACDMYLNALEKHHFDVLAPALHQGAVSPLAYLFRVKYHQLRRTY